MVDFLVESSSTSGSQADNSTSGFLAKLQRNSLSNKNVITSDPKTTSRLLLKNSTPTPSGDAQKSVQLQASTDTQVILNPKETFKLSFSNRGAVRQNSKTSCQSSLIVAANGAPHRFCHPDQLPTRLTDNFSSPISSSPAIYDDSDFEICVSFCCFSQLT